MASLRAPAASFEPGPAERHGEVLARIRAAVGLVIRGKPEAIELLLLALLAGGHALVEDVPGVGKTTLAKALARVFDIGFSRVQFTPDLLPADILGSLVLDPTVGSFSFHRGPIFTNVLLADEINRASPRTQSALLEAMSEAQVTVDGTTYPLAAPFFVFATQNPHEFAGTYPLPEAQLDRFLVCIAIGYPSEDEELSMLYAQAARGAARQARRAGDAHRPARDPDRGAERGGQAGRRPLPALASSPRRAGTRTSSSARAPAARSRSSARRRRAHTCSGRGYVSPDDVQSLAGPVLGHRIVLTPEARYGGRGADGVVKDVVQSLRIPM